MENLIIGSIVLAQPTAHPEIKTKVDEDLLRHLKQQRESMSLADYIESMPRLHVKRPS